MKFVFSIVSVIAFRLLSAYGEQLPDWCLQETDDDLLDCIDTNQACTTDPDKCCDGLVCVGFSFFKKCIEPPICLHEWHDCSDGTPCCDNKKCIIHDSNHYECAEEKFGSRTLELEEMVPPTNPPQQVNYRTTHISGKNVAYQVASSSGDPHIVTFDGLKYDCQGEGEFVLAKSKVTQREVQVRYEHQKDNRAVSFGKAVVIQDEGETPRVQLSITELQETLGNDMGDGCKLQLFIDSTLKDLEKGFEDKHLVIDTADKKHMTVRYKETGMEATINYFRCRINVNLKLPNTDLTYGLLGTANGNVEDDWENLEGEITPQPKSLADRMRKPAYDFCTKQFCLRDESKSLFFYPEHGFDFSYYQKCDLPYGDTLEKFIENVPKSVIDACGSDMACIIDVGNGDAEDAKMLRLASLEYSGSCNPAGGECDESECCEGLQCINYGGTAGSICDGNTECTPEFGNCESISCCGELMCVETNDGTKQCRDERVCQEEWMGCDDKDCCDGLVCLGNENRGVKQCRKISQCMRVLDDCSMAECCDALRCVTTSNGGKQCQDIPDCWDQQWKDCSQTPCCDGLTCINHEGRDVCRRLPKCVKMGKSCQHSPCCDDDERGPLECVEVHDSLGHTDMQCRLKPGEAEVLVFRDLNTNGIRDDDEPGIENVKLVLVQGVQKEIISDELITDDRGIVKFPNVPRGKALRVLVVKGPPGAEPTKLDQGENDEIDSDLKPDGLTHPFRLTSSGDVWKNTMLGYLIAQSIQVTVFNDLDGNGIKDEGDEGLKGVVLRLLRYDKEKGFVAIQDLKNGGNSHETQTSDEKGIVTFTAAPQNVALRVQVIKKPDGAVPTKTGRGDDGEIGSDLRTDGFSGTFRLQGDIAVYSSCNLGFRLP